MSQKKNGTKMNNWKMSPGASGYAAAVLLIGMVVAVAIIGTFFDPRDAHGAPADNQNVTVRLNVTNTEPIVYQVVLDDLTPSPENKITLAAGGTREVLCNASASDWNGQNDLHNATASIYALSAGFFAPDTKADHYTNSTCREYADVAGTTTNRTFTCRFNMEYFAFNTTWQCNMTVRDFGGTQLAAQKLFLNSTGTDNAEVNELIAINVSTTSIDYGNLSVTETSGEQIINLTNAGNVRTNFTVLAYGGLNKTLDTTNLNFTSMLCEYRNISIGQHRYSNVTGANWANMINASFNATVFNNITLFNRTSETDPLAGSTTNSTYWKIKVPLSVGGLCNGTIEFAATSLSS